MGIFNFFIVIPQLVAASLLGFLLKTFFGGQPIQALMIGGVSLIVAGLCVLRVQRAARGHGRRPAIERALPVPNLKLRPLAALLLRRDRRASRRGRHAPTSTTAPSNPSPAKRCTSSSPTASSTAIPATTSASRAAPHPARLRPAGAGRRRARATTSATSAATSTACSTTPTTSATWVSARCGSRRSSTTPTRPSPAASRSSWGSFWTDQGKTGYHGYWGVNFYKLDEHLPSPGLDFAGFTKAMHGTAAEGRARHRRQPRLAGVHDAEGPAEVRQGLRPRRQAARRPPEPAAGQARSGAQPAARVLQHARPSSPSWPTSTRTTRPCSTISSGAYEQWIDAGRRRVPHRHHRLDAARVLEDSSPTASARSVRASSCSARTSTTTPAKIAAAHLARRTARISVLDFPLKERMAQVFGRTTAHGFENLQPRAVPAGRSVREPVRPDDLLRQPRHAAPGRHATKASSTRTTGCSPRAASRWSTTARRSASCAAAPSTPATATTSARNASMPRSAIRSARTSSASPGCAQHRRRCSAACSWTCVLKGDRAAFYRVYQHDGRVADRAGAAQQGRCAGARSRSKRWLAGGALEGGDRRRRSAMVAEGKCADDDCAGAWRRGVPAGCAGDTRRPARAALPDRADAD